ncbi:hypothetical protein ABT214_04895, partial [Micromonospora purpureochromogenes]
MHVGVRLDGQSLAVVVVPGRRRGGVQQPVRHLVRHVQAPERVVRRRIGAAALVHGAPDPPLDQAESGEQLGRG